MKEEEEEKEVVTFLLPLFCSFYEPLSPLSLGFFGSLSFFTYRRSFLYRVLLIL